MRSFIIALLFALPLAAQTYPVAGPGRSPGGAPTGMVEWFKFIQGASSTTLYDLSGNGNNGTIATTSPQATFLTYSGNPYGLRMPNSSATLTSNILSSASAATIAFTIRPMNQSAYTYMSLWSYGSSSSAEVGFDYRPSGQMAFFSETGGEVLTTASTYPQSISGPLRVMLTWNSSTFTLYFNGVQVGTATNTHGVIPSALTSAGQYFGNDQSGHTTVVDDYYEFLAYPSVLSTANLAALDAHMQAWSTEGLPSSEKWQMTATALLSGTGGTNWNSYIENPLIIQSSGTFYLFHNSWTANSGGSAVGSIGMASGTALSSLGTDTQELTPTAAQWDAGWVDVCGYYDGGATKYLYYCGSSTVGFEAGLVKIGVATSTSWAGPWVKYVGNPIQTNGASSLWNASVVLSGSTYYMFSSLDASGIYYSTASSPLGPWSGLTLIVTPPQAIIDTRFSDVEVDLEGSTWVMRYSAYLPVGSVPQTTWRMTSSSPAGPWVFDQGSPIKILASQSINGFNRLSTPTVISGSYVSALDCFTTCSGNGKLWEITKQ